MGSPVIAAGTPADGRRISLSPEEQGGNLPGLPKEDDVALARLRVWMVAGLALSVPLCAAGQTLPANLSKVF